MTSTTASKPHLILIPGAWHTSSCYSLIIPPLESARYPVTALTLPSVGAEPPLENMDADVQTIRDATLRILASGQDAVVVMHSYGGVPGSEAMQDLSKSDRAAQGKATGVTALVYLCAWMISPGESVFSSGGGQGGKGGPKRVRVEDGKIYHLDPIGAFYHDLPPPTATQHSTQLTHHSYATLHSTLQYPAYRFIPSTYLYCTADDTIPYERQQKLVQDAGVEIKTEVCDASHSPFLSQPKLVVRVIREGAGEMGVEQ